MKTLSEIQNDFAIKHGYKNIAELMEESVKKGNTLQILVDLDKICIKVQQEQQKLIAENARLQVNDIIRIDKSSIINENNIIR